MKYLLFITLAASLNANALDNKAFSKGVTRLKKAYKSQVCLDEARTYADALRAGEDTFEQLETCLKNAKFIEKSKKDHEKRIERLKKAGF